MAKPKIYNSHSDYLKVWRSENLEYIKSYREKYRQGDGAMVMKKYLDNYREENKEKLRKQNKDYRRSFLGKISLTYSSMKSRVKKKDGEKSHIYYGISLCDKKEFIEFSKNDIQFKKLHSNWIKNNYQLKYSPSIDRIDSNKGYLLDNIQWLTYSENSKKR